jgi:hypothetical protein
MFQPIRKLLFLILVLSIASPVAAGERVTVVELFTSQGCSACPPADALLKDLVQYPDLLPLSEHVDYWDYLGWRDPYARPELTQRQRQYAQQLGLSYVYTPQFIVQGMAQAGGRDRASVLRLISDVQALPKPAVVDTLRSDDGRFVARLERVALPSAADIWLVQYVPERMTLVAHGENSGRSVENINVVRQLTLLDQWTGEPKVVPLSGELPIDGPFAVLVQQSNAGPILGAARFQIPSR